MPETITLEDGSTREVMTQEEITELQTKATEVDTQLSAKEEEYKAKMEELNSQVNPNWKAAREKLERAEEELKKHNLSFDEQGNLIDNAQKPVNMDEVVQKATEAAENSTKQMLFNQQKAAVAAKYPEENRETILHYVSKLTANEEVGIGDLDKYFAMAANLVIPNYQAKAGPATSPSTYGAPPQFTPPNASQNFGETDKGREIANELFGDMSFGKVDPKTKTF